MAIEPSLYLVRHGESLSNIRGQVGGDLELSTQGKEQSVNAGLLIADRLGSKQPQAILHTGLLRTYQTAEIIKLAGNFDCPIIETPGFRERYMGIYEKLSFAEFLSINPKTKALYTQYGSSCVWFFEDESQGVESIDSMKKRIIQNLLTLQELYATEPIILVAHSGSIKMIRMIHQDKSCTDASKYLSSYVPNNGEVYELNIQSTL